MDDVLTTSFVILAVFTFLFTSIASFAVYEATKSAIALYKRRKDRGVNGKGLLSPDKSPSSGFTTKGG